MTISRPEVDVVILTWNDGDLLDHAVRSALASTDVAVRVVVVDNGSSPPAVVAADLADRVTVARVERNLGVAAGRNRGASLGHAPVICFLDSDARLHPGSLDVLLTELLADPGHALVAPVFDGQDPGESGGVAPDLRRKVARALGRTGTYAAPAPAGGDAAWDVDFAIGACQVFRREAFDAVGRLDESFFYGPEDADFCMRLRLAGWRVRQVAGAGCEHPARRRNRRLTTARGVRHGWAVARFLWRHRHYRRDVPLP